MAETASWAYWVYPLLSMAFALANFILVDALLESPRESAMPLASTQAGAAAIHSEPEERSARQKLHSLWASTPIWTVLALLLGPALAKLSYDLLFVLAWAVVCLEVFRVRLFNTILYKFIGNAAICLFLMLPFWGAWRIFPKPKEPPTADQFVSKFAERFPWLGNQPQKSDSGAASQATVHPAEPKLTQQTKTVHQSPPCMQDISTCSDVVITKRVVEITQGIDQLYEKHLQNLTESNKQMRDAETDGERESVRFAFEAKTDMILNQYRSKYRAPALEYREQLEARIGPSAHDEAAMRYYEISDTQTSHQGVKVIFPSNMQITNLPKISEDLRETAKQLQSKTMR